MRKHLLSILGASLALVAAMPSSAATVVFSGFTNGSESVNFSVTGPHPTSGAALAGGFATTVDGGPSFEAYCVDLYQEISFGDPYPEYTGPGTTHVFANSRAYTDLGRLYATAGVVNTAVSEAAFQIAVWEIAYETDSGPYDLSSGVATFSGGDAATGTPSALSLASSWLGNLTNGPYPSILVLESADHQDMIYAPVPEPETYALFMAGLAAVGFVARRRKP